MQRPITAMSAALVALVWHAPASRLHAQAPEANTHLRAPLEIVTDGHGAYASTAMQLQLRTSARTSARTAAAGDVTEAVQWETSDPGTAWVSSNGTVVFMNRGHVTISAHSGADSVTRTFDVRDNPAQQVTLAMPAQARVGSRVQVKAEALDGKGNAVSDEAVNLAASNGARVSPSGEFVASAPGTYTVTAQAGGAAATRTIVVTAGGVEQQGVAAERIEQAPHALRAARVTLTTDIRDVFVGDSLPLHADAIASGARRVDGAHVVYGVTEPGSPDGPHASITPDGRFVATRPGVYTIFAAIGDLADAETILVQQRPMR